MKYANSEFTPSNIRKLKENEIFVFGSNLQGMHLGGAAATALISFGAVYGQGVGLQGRSYAIPTMLGSTEELRPYVSEFIAFAASRPDLKFFLTEVGCGIAGFSKEQIALLFKDALGVRNIIMPESFVRILEAAEQ